MKKKSFKIFFPNDSNNGSQAKDLEVGSAVQCLWKKGIFNPYIMPDGQGFVCLLKGK